MTLTTLEPMVGPGRGLLDPTAASLARELAQDIRPVDAVLRDYGFDGPDDPLFRTLAESADFKRVLDESIREWNAADTTKRRIMLKAQAAVELQLSSLHQIAMDPRADKADRINATKLMKSLGGMDAPPGGGNGMGADGGGGVTVKIVIGAQQMVKTVATMPTIIEHDSQPSPESDA